MNFLPGSLFSVHPSVTHAHSDSNNAAQAVKLPAPQLFPNSLNPGNWPSPELLRQAD